MSSSPSPDFASPGDIAARQGERWREQRRYVLAHSPFFKSLWSTQSVPLGLEDLPSLPLCDKEMLRRSQAETPPFGNYLAAPDQAVIGVHRTSGTTGVPMNLALSAADAEQTAEVGGARNGPPDWGRDIASFTASTTSCGSAASPITPPWR